MLSSISIPLLLLSSALSVSADSPRQYNNHGNVQRALHRSSERGFRAPLQPAGMAKLMRKRTIDAAALVAQVKNSTNTFKSIATWYAADGSVSACGTSGTTNDSAIIGLPTSVWNDMVGGISPLCGQSVLLTNTDTGKNTTAVIGDSSGEQDYTSLTPSVFLALGGDLNVGEFALTVFVNSTAAPIIVATTSSSAAVAVPTKKTSPVPIVHTKPSVALPVPSVKPSPAYVAPAPATKSPAYVPPKVIAQPSPPAPAPAPAKSSPPSNNNGGGNGGGASGNIVSGGSATFFTQGGVAGACGTVHQDSDYVIAMQTVLYNNGANCGRKIRLTRTSTGQSITATVADECPTCINDQSLDLSVAAFNALASPDVGMFDITWQFV